MDTYEIEDTIVMVLTKPEAAIIAEALSSSRLFEITTKGFGYNTISAAIRVLTTSTEYSWYRPADSLPRRAINRILSLLSEQKTGTGKEDRVKK